MSEISETVVMSFVSNNNIVILSGGIDLTAVEYFAIIVIFKLPIKLQMASFVPDQHWRKPSTKASMASLSRVQNIIGDYDPAYTMKYYDEWSQHYEEDLKVPN